MNFLLFQLKRLISFPVEFFSSPNGAIRSLWSESGRSRALLLGVPAVLFAVMGVAFLMFAKFGLAGTLEETYKARLENSAQEKTRLLTELKTEARMLRASQQASDEILDQNLISKDDVRVKELENWKDQERIYLEKLIDLNPNEPEYLFKLAQVSFSNRDLNRCLALMNLTAPLDEPGYVEGHLWLSRFYMNAPAKNQRQANDNVDLAMAHAEQCLKREQDNVLAKQIKATLMFAKNGDLKGSYGIFLDLFEEEPRYYKSLIEINKRLGLESRSNRILEIAIGRFESNLEKEDLGPADRVKIWNDLTDCYVERKEFELIEQKLLEEIQFQSKLEGGLGRVWVERMLSAVYVKWISNLDRKTEAGTAQQLKFLKEAFRLDPSNVSVMRQLTRLGSSTEPVVAGLAREIYNPANDDNAPANVLNEIGMQALGQSQHKVALEYFERAFIKAPKNPEILNNLAYTLSVIVGEEKNLPRALTLIDQALTYLPRNQTSKQYRTYFHDTRGQILMQMNKWTSAIAEFEKAIVDRPGELKILESLVKCCRASGLDEGTWLRRIETLNQKNAAEGGEANRESGFPEVGGQQQPPSNNFPNQIRN